MTGPAADNIPGLDTGEVDRGVSRDVVAAVAILAQAALWYLLGQSVASWAVSAVGAAAYIALLYARYSRRFIIALTVVLVQFAGILYAALTSPSSSWRLAVVALVLFYVGWGFALCINKLGWLSLPNAFLLCASVVGSAFAIESVWETGAPLSGIVRQFLNLRGFQKDLPILWVGNGYRLDPIHGNVPQPYGHLKTFFPSNPRGYFLEVKLDRDSWRLSTNNGNLAELTFSEADQTALRVAILAVKSQQTWDIALSRDGLPVQLGAKYALHFRVRADRDRKLTYMVSEDGPPWTDKGLLREVAVEPSWHDIDSEFQMSGRNGSARVVFNFGGDSASVDLADVALRRTDSGEVVRPVTAHKYFIPVDLNDHGCRGHDYAIPRPDNTIRIIVLGNSQTLGWGVKYADLFTTRMEEMLNAAADRHAPRQHFEVINCGVVAYGTAQERWLYETTLADYRPQVVLLMTQQTDDQSVEDRLLEQEYLKPYPWERVFVTPYLVRLQVHFARRRDYGGVAKEVLQLKNTVERDGGHLAIAQFDGVKAYPNAEPFETLKRLLTGTGVALVNLGQALDDARPSEELMVYPDDHHPNELVHGAVAVELAKFLEQSGLLRTTSQGAVN